MPYGHDTPVLDTCQYPKSSNLMDFANLKTHGDNMGAPMVNFSLMTESISLGRITGERISKLLGKRWVGSQEELAAELDVHQTHVSKLASGAKLPSLQVLAKLVEILETNADYILGLTDDDKPASDLDDQVVIGVKDPARRRLVQEVCSLLTEMSDEDAEIIWRMARRIGSIEPTDEKVREKWNDMWLSVYMVGGADWVARFERDLKVRRPRFLRTLMEDQAKKPAD